MNYWPRWINAIKKRTASLSLAQMGAYDRLLDHYYAEERPLPGTLDECCRIAGAINKDEREAVRFVLARFFTLGDEGFSNERADEEIAIAKPKIEAARKNGASGGRPRKLPLATDQKPNGFPVGTHEEPRPKAPQRREEIPNTPPHPPGGVSFGEFWDQWPKHPRKVARLQCAKKWASFGLDAIAGEVMASLAAHKSSKAWAKDAGNFIPAPLVWLNQRRWEAPTEAEAANEAADANWRESRSGIESKGAELGLGRWDQQAFELGEGEPFSAYTARVMVAAGLAPRKVAA